MLNMFVGRELSRTTSDRPGRISDPRRPQGRHLNILNNNNYYNTEVLIPKSLNDCLPYLSRAKPSLKLASDKDCIGSDSRIPFNETPPCLIKILIEFLEVSGPDRMSTIRSFPDTGCIIWEFFRISANILNALSEN